jgi:hypothetical protein
VVVGTVALIGGLAFWLTRSAGGGSGGGDSFVSASEATNLEASPSGIMSLGPVAYGGGIVSKSFEVTNNSDKAIKLRKITTSCMCTAAKVKMGDKETKLFGMEMNGDLNPLIDFDIPAGATVQAIFNFDPAAHGPQGIGAIDREITLFFDVGYKTLEFNGEVVK